MQTQLKTIENPNDCKKSARTPNLAVHATPPAAETEPPRKLRPQGAPRSHVAYWKSALHTCPRTGNYFVQIFHRGRRARFTFGRNAEAAAERARLIYKSLESQGWRETLEKFSARGAAREQRREEDEAAQAHDAALGGRIEKPTVGDLIRISGELSTVRPATMHGYAKALRFIVSEVFAVPHTEEISAKRKLKGRRGVKARPTTRLRDIRHDYRTGGLAKWREAVDSVRLDQLAPADVQRWRKEYLTRAGADPVAVDHARVSFNKTLRNAKALFGRKVRPFLESKLLFPKPLFFEGVSMEPTPPLRYQSKIDPSEILRKASDNLSVQNPEAFKTLFLCLVLGLRRREADTLLWSQVDFQRREVNIAPTEHYALKSRDSARVLALDNASLALLRGWRAKASGEFVMESPIGSRPLARTPVYRCQKTFTELAAWLREAGITARKPIHELRKECGTMLLKQGQPVEAVSRYLGHATIQITMAHYADMTKHRATVDFAALLPSAAVAHFAPPAGEETKPAVHKRRKA